MKLKTQRGGWREGNKRYRTKWVHLDRCKVYPGEIALTTPEPEQPMSGISERLETNGEELVVAQPLQNSAGNSGGEIDDERTDIALPSEESEQAHAANEYRNEVPAAEPEEVQRRYPSRIKKPKQYYGEFIPWDRVSNRFKEKN